MVRDLDGEIRAFHNVCRHRGNKLVWVEHAAQDSLRRRPRSSPASTTAGGTGSTARAPTSTSRTSSSTSTRPTLGLAPVHCDVWAGFVFVNLAETPRQSLRDYLGPMVGALEGYPFDLMTERYSFRAENASNWKVFIDAFQEYYHVPPLHTHQLGPASTGTRRRRSRARTTSSTGRTGS